MANVGLLRPCALSRASGPFQRSGQTFAHPDTNPAAALACKSARGKHGAGALDRRDVLLLSSSLVLSHVAQLEASLPAHAAGRGLERYVRKRALDPLETYVPLVLEARALLPGAKRLGLINVGAARELLRQGPYSTLRENIRAISEYAVRDGRTTEVGALVTGFFRALESYDLLLADCLREKQFPAEEKLNAAIADIDDAIAKVLATVPADVMEKAERVFDVANAESSAAAIVQAVEQAEGKAGEAGEGKSAAAALELDEEAAALVRLLR
ncbi:hypothetical protein HYH03_000218 [Edaphochlamys debaryana]|uniref:DUF7880 domain-containing protein n=1 Tax=Edaphochlamys debaryana TaxID=47281 RepID=A0A836C7F2_9CHLO|nr:hypothetical protein HYH03_000218 [Edaphochlamys debaryana]|eukprot:KAG2501717.1 hypothetical protein HYH03_000218 [Edaphochlamys debaryana]